MSNVLNKIREAIFRRTVSGTASPKGLTVFETKPDIPLADVMKFYERDPTCKASVDLLASATVGMGFYTTVNEEYEKAEEAKDVVDKFNEEVNLDALLNDMAKVLIACGNDFWLKITPERLEDLHRLPIDAVEKVVLNPIKELKVPYKVESYKLRNSYGGRELRPEAVIHWRINYVGNEGFGIGILQVLLHTLTINSDKRPSYAWAKSKIEKLLPKIFEKYAGPDVLAVLEGAKEDTIKKFEKAIKNRPEEGAWLFYNRKADLKPVTIDPRTQFGIYIEHILNQFYLGCETPLPRLFSTPGFTEASANAALDLQDLLIKPIQRYIKRQVERDIFTPVLRQAGFDPADAGVRLNWGTPDMPEIKIEHWIELAKLHAQGIQVARIDEIRKNLKKFGFELWEPESESSRGNQSERGGENP